MEKDKEKRRDAERSRQRILAVAEEMFAELGFARTSLNAVAQRAGLSRGTPSYFFGSKERLYEAVLERVFAEREAATEKACAPLRDWADGKEPLSLKQALTEAVDGYLSFLRDRPSFVLLLQREELAGAARLRTVQRESSAIAAGFEAIRSVAKERGLKEFDVTDSVLVFVSLTFSPLAQQATFLAALDRDLGDRQTRQRHIELVVDQLLHLIGG